MDLQMKPDLMPGEVNGKIFFNLVGFAAWLQQITIPDEQAQDWPFLDEFSHKDLTLLQHLR